MTVAGNCPSSLGTWDKYDIVKDAQGNTVSINKYCDAADVEVAHNQSDMDAVATTAGGVSNNDFQGTSTCSSGSFTKNGQTYQGIWYKQ